MKRFFNILLFLCLSLSLYAQADRKEVRRGNREFKRGDFKQSEISYRKALVKDSTSFAGNYNLAASLYRQKDYEAASNALGKIKEQAAGNAKASDYWFNLGDVALQKKDYQGAVDAFKQSLLLAPDDVSAKSNYLYAKKMLENQQNQQNQDQNQQNQQDQNQDQNKDQNKNDDQNKDQDQDQNKDQNNNNNDQNNNQDRNQSPQQAPSKISPQQGQQIIQAMQAKEKETQDKVNKEKAAMLSSRQKEKNW